MDYVVCTFFLDPDSEMRGVATMPADKVRISYAGTHNLVNFYLSEKNWATYLCHRGEPIRVLPAQEAAELAGDLANQLYQAGKLIEQPR